jgi:hypothetical protein
MLNIPSLSEYILSTAGCPSESIKTLPKIQIRAFLKGSNIKKKKIDGAVQ